MKRLLCWLLALCAVFTLLPLPAFATTAEELPQVEQIVTADLSEQEETTTPTEETTEPTEETTEPTEETTAPTEPPKPVKPKKPSLKVSTGKTSGKPELSWCEDAGAESFQIYYATSKSGKYKKLTTVTENRYVHKSATAGKTYYYKVCAVAEDGSKTSYSSVKSATAKLGAPAVTVSVDASSGKLKLKWKKESGTKKFYIYRATSENGEYKKLTTTTSTSYTDKSAKTGKTYFYKVKAYHSKSSYNSPYSAVVNGFCVLGKPEVKLSNAASGMVKLEWNEIQNAIQYIIFRAPAGSEEFAEYTRVSHNTFTEESMEVGERYSYQVQAIFDKEEANSPKSEIVTGICKLASPNAKGVATKTGKGQISWDTVPGAVSYTVKRATSKTGTYKILDTLNAVEGQESYVYEVSLSTGKTYYFQIIANAEDKSVNSEAKALSVKGGLSAPTMKTTASVTKTTVQVSWKKEDGASGYYVYRRKADSDESWTKVGTTTSTSYTDKKASGKLEYCVAAYKTVSKEKHAGVKSDPITVRTLAAASSASVTKADVGWTNYITWKQVSGATGYELYRKVTTAKTWELVGTFTSELEYIDGPLDNFHGKYLHYRVRAVYECDGVVSYGPYKQTGQWGGRWHSPSINYFLSQYTDYGNFVVLEITNNGDETLRLYSSGARWLGGGSFNKDCYLVDDNIRKLSYVDIKAGESKWITLRCATGKNWYDKKTTIRLTARYCGQKYTLSMSRYYGGSFSRHTK